MDRITLSDKVVGGLSFAQGGQQIVRDDQLRGFFLLVGARSKTFMIQADLWVGANRRSVRLKVGEAGRLTTREARAKAKVLLGKIADGIDPRPKRKLPSLAHPKKRSPTLQSAWKIYRESHLIRKERDEKTINNYRDHVERLMSDWLDVPLNKLGKDPGLVKAKHDWLTLMHGPYQANGCMRTFRAIYNHARKTAPSLPAANPVFAIDWNPEKRRNSGMGPRDLPGWFEQLRLIDNPIRRELHLFLLLSGSRPDPIKKAKPAHFDFGARQLFVPRPKGGSDKAFCIPLSREMVLCLARALRFGRMMHPEASQEWIFPSESETGHIYEHKEDRAELSHWGNDLRQTYRTIGQVAGAGDVDMHLLMNHSLPGVNAGYITRAGLVDAHLRKVQQAISTTMFDTLRKSGFEQAGWPSRSGRQLLQYELPERAHQPQGNGYQKCSRNMAVFRRDSDHQVAKRMAGSGM